MMADTFIVRTWSVNAATEPADRDAGDDVDAAITLAQSLSGDKQYRSVIVTDQRSMVWAQFNMLWAAREDSDG
jgi:hypothetical protein